MDEYNEDISHKDIHVPQKFWSWKRVFISVIFGGVGIVALMLFFPRFHEKVIISIPDGATIRDVARNAYEHNIIYSENIFVIGTMIAGNHIRSGDYVFESSSSLIQVVRRFHRGIYGATAVKIVIPEGSTRLMIAENLHEKLPHIDTATFMEMTKDDEGYLYPDTYFFFPSATYEIIIGEMRRVFDERIAEIDASLLEDKQQLHNTVIMASLLEKESTAHTDERAIISGILWKRLRQGMPLQVDAPFLFLLGKGSSELTLDDLHADGPYNTYTRKGLPAGPIGNPGIDTLRAARYPQESPYLFYLHDEQGNVHYARTYDEHIMNKRRYLR